MLCVVINGCRVLFPVQGVGLSLYIGAFKLQRLDSSKVYFEWFSDISLL